MIPHVRDSCVRILRVSCSHLNSNRDTFIFPAFLHGSVYLKAQICVANSLKLYIFHTSNTHSALLYCLIVLVAAARFLRTLSCAHNAFTNHVMHVAEEQATSTFVLLASYLSWQSKEEKYERKPTFFIAARLAPK